ncbi:unnamed protein product, partial [Rotaria magnacalcarata]
WLSAICTSLIHENIGGETMIAKSLEVLIKREMMTNVSLVDPTGGETMIAKSLEVLIKREMMTNVSLVDPTTEWASGSRAGSDETIQQLTILERKFGNIKT